MQCSKEDLTRVLNILESLGDDHADNCDAEDCLREEPNSWHVVNMREAHQAITLLRKTLNMEPCKADWYLAEPRWVR